MVYNPFYLNGDLAYLYEQGPLESPGEFQTKRDKEEKNKNVKLEQHIQNQEAKEVKSISIEKQIEMQARHTMTIYHNYRLIQACSHRHFRAVKGHQVCKYCGVWTECLIGVKLLTL